MHLSYGFNLKPHSCSVSDSSHQNSKAAFSVPYRAFLSLTYNIGLPFSFSQIMASRDTIGKLLSDFVVYSCCDLPSAHHLSLIVPSHFSFRNIKFLSAFFLCLYAMSSFLSGNSAFHSCSWFNSFNIASLPQSPKAFIPCLMFICLIITFM